jgi:hypothetical protein
MLPLFPFNLNDYFEDIDNDELSFSVSGNEALEISISTSGKVTITAPEAWYGIETVVFSADDGNGGNISMNPIELEVEYVSGISIPIPTRGGGGSTTKTKIASLDVSIPSVTMASTDRLKVPFSLYNSGEQDFIGINLSTFFDVKGLKIDFLEDTYINGLSIGETYNSSLLFETDEVEAGNYSVEFIAKTGNPKLTQTSTIYVTIQQRDFTNKSLQKQISFAEDLFQQNPECLELMEIVTRAKKQIADNELSTAYEAINQAIRDCQELISDNTPDVEKISFTAFLVDNFPILLIISGVMVFIYVIAIALLRK